MIFKSKAVQSDSDSENSRNNGNVTIVNVDESVAAAFRDYHTNPEVRKCFEDGARIANRSNSSSSDRKLK